MNSSTHGARTTAQTNTGTYISQPAARVCDESSSAPIMGYSYENLNAVRALLK
ncbi:hypothetical protein D3C85_1805100 [compost metagenome]